MITEACRGSAGLVPRPFKVHGLSGTHSSYSIGIKFTLKGLFLAPVSVIDDPSALENGDERLSKSSVVASVVLVLQHHSK